MLLQSNIRKLYGFIVAQNALTIVPVLVPFLQSHGLSLQEVFWLQGLYTFTWVVADVPTGYFADIWSRRRSLIIGAVFLCLSGFGYAFGNRFWHFCLMEVLFGIGMAFNSGIIQAMTYDTLIELDDTESYRKVCSHQNIAASFSTALAGILGGLIANENIQMAGTLMLPFFVIALGIALTIQEPKRHVMQPGSHLKNMGEILSGTIFRCSTLSSIILVFSLSAAMTFGLVWFSQPYQTSIGMPLRYFGIANAIFMAGLMTASKSAHILEKHLDNRIFLVLLLIIAISSFFALGSGVSVIGLVFLLIGRSTYGALEPLTSDMINRLTTSDRRATVLSIRSFGYNVFFTIFSPVIGYAAKIFSLNEALLMIGIGGCVLSIPIFILLKKSWKELPD